MAETFHTKSQTEIEQEFETKLIRTVFNFRWLYDNIHPDFTNAAKNRLSWTRVANIVQRPLTECANRWNSLLQTYFSSTSPNWIHYDDLKKFEPHLHNNFRIPNQFDPTQKPNAIQKNELLTILLNNRFKILSPQTTLVERQGVWSQITLKCNSIQPGAYMGALEWKKYWYELKQNFGIQRLMLQSKLKAMGTKLDVSKNSEDDMKIVKICGASMDDTTSVIAKALGSNIELGFNSDLIIPKCVRCLKQRNQLIIDGYCESCHNLPSCDVCNVVCDSNIVRYKTSKWSVKAKNLLPKEARSIDSIAVCFGCSLELNRQATKEWKACRICESEQPNLEFLFGSGNSYLKRSLINITNIAISETDGLPGYICKCCKIQTQQLNNFYTKFCRIQIKLKNIHSKNFIGNSVHLTSLTDSKDGKVIYLNANENSNDKQESLIADISIQKEAVVPSGPTTSISSASTTTTTTTSTIQRSKNFPTYKISQIQQANQIPTYKVTTAISAASSTATELSKRVSIQKIVKADGSQIAEVKNRPLPMNPPLAIKEIFSLQPSAQKSKTVTKPNIKVIPTVALQHAKMHGIFSNETVTVTRKIIDVPAAGTAASSPQTTAAPPPPTTSTPATFNTKQPINIVNLANGNSVTLQPPNNPITLHRGLTLTKRPAVAAAAPNVTTATPNVTTAIQQAEPNSTTSAKPIELDKIKSNPAPTPTHSTSNPTPTPTISATVTATATKTSPPNIIAPKASSTTKPAIFTVSDYETIEDAPPVFCIPKKNTSVENKTSEAEAEKQLMNFNPSNAPIIKSEILDTDECPIEEVTNVVQDHPIPVPPQPPQPQLQLQPQFLPQQLHPLPTPTTSIENIPGLPPLLNEAEPCTNAAGMKIIRLNGAMVAVKPHPHISGAFIPVDLNTSMDVPAVKPNRIPTYIRKVETTPKSQLSTGNLTPKKAPNLNEGKSVTVATKPPPPKAITKNVQGPSINPANVQYNQAVSDASLFVNPEQHDQFMQHKGLQQQQLLQLQMRQHKLQRQLDQQLQKQQMQQEQLQQQIQQKKQNLQQQQPPQQPQLQQQQLQQQQQGIKKPRKYWGNVDEFHVTNQPSKAPLPTSQSLSSMPTTQQQQPTEQALPPMQRTSLVPPWVEERKTPTPAEDPLNISTNVNIKEELPDNDADDVSVVKTRSEATPGMFYPDSFELENVIFGADVSMMIDTIMIQQSSIIDSNSMDGNSFDKYINPAFPISYGKRQLQPDATKVDIKENESKKMKKQDESNKEARVETEANAEADDDSKKKQEEQNKNEKENINTKDDPNKQSSLICGVKIKKFCIKLKRARDPKFFARPKRLCTLQSKNSRSSSPASLSMSPVSPSVTEPPPVLMSKRKSLRLNQT